MRLIKEKEHGREKARYFITSLTDECCLTLFHAFAKTILAIIDREPFIEYYPKKTGRDLIFMELLKEIRRLG